MEHLGPHWKDFQEIFYLSTFRKSVEKIQVSFKSDKNNVKFTRRHVYIYDHISLGFFRITNISDRSCSENQNKYFTSSNSLRKSRAVADNVEESRCE